MCIAIQPKNRYMIFGPYRPARVCVCVCVCVYSRVSVLCLCAWMLGSVEASTENPGY